MWWRLRNHGNVASNNEASKCGVRHKCGGASEIMEMWRQTMWRQNVASGTNVVAPPKSWKCGVKQCGVKMWRQAQMWRQSEMWRQTMWRQNVASGTLLTKLCFRKCVFKKGIQWQAQKYYTICLYPVYMYKGCKIVILMWLVQSIHP